MSEVAGEKKVVCVTGASGYIASWLVKFLLQRGYNVRATVRDPNDPKKTEHLLALDGAKERLHLFKAELLDEGAFDSVVDGCEGVFHTASPVSLSPADPQEELIDPAEKGTINVLTSCAKASTIKRVVITSSIVSVMFNGKPLTPGVVVDETWYSDPGFCEESKLWYVLSKTLAEEAAWKIAKDKGIDLVTVHPGLVIGPLLQQTLSLSIELFLGIINGAQTSPMTIYRFVDVRDVAEAHIRALESPSSNGRYCLVGEVMHSRDALKILRKLYPTNLRLPERCGDDDADDEEASVATYKISKDKAVSLGIRFTPLEVSFKDTLESLKEQGFLKD